MLGRIERIACAAALIVPATAGAMECAFVSECIPGEPCAETAFAVGVETDPAAGRAELVTDFGTFAGLYSNVRGALPANVTAFSGDSRDSHGLSWTATGAWSTVHLPGSGMAITYTGLCEVAE
ncbi:hypothetical protein [Jannaschia sp. LMIT008]|uniref:hypothetical protein n=1 Tax=Jannaschia maritima TaxID=3032585 RepID=UPI00281258DF|nr:hypothetical protein [Jannaschia sp. LMIT008]